MSLSKTRRCALAGLLLWGTACGGGTDTPPPSAPATTISATARSYLNSVISVMQANSINRAKIDWTALRAQAIAASGSAQTVRDTYPGIRAALAILGDGHSSYRGADGSVIFVSNRSCVGTGATTPGNIPQDVGYVKVGAFSGSADQAIAFATAIQTTIRNADRDSLAGWIVDLRGNGGGNMWPMIAGLGPVLGEGLLGYFIDPAGAETPWEYRNGASYSRNAAVTTVATPYQLRIANPKVAVLVDNAVASSGEATFIAFRTRGNTRSFGVATCGLSTANSGYPLSDGALLNLTVSVMADRTKVAYGDKVPPDESIAGTTAVVDRAIGWLRGANQ